MTVRVFAVDGRPEPDQGLAISLASLPGIEVIGEASDGAEAVQRATALRPDVVVLNLDAVSNGIDMTRDIVLRRPGIAVLALTGVDDGDWVFAAMRAGARGCLRTGADHREIAVAARAVAGGAVLCDAAIATSALTWFASHGDSLENPFPELTDRELEILDLAAHGLTTPAIAHRLFLPEVTVRSHVASVFMKLQVADRRAAVARAREADMGHE